MRITEQGVIRAIQQSMRRAQTRVAQAAEKLSGDGVRRASSDVLAWTEATRAQMRVEQGQAYQDALSRAQTRLEQTDHALATIGEGLTRALELAVQSANESTATARTVAGHEVEKLLDLARAAKDTPTLDEEPALLAGFLVPRTVAAGETLTLPAAAPENTLTSGGVDVLATFDALAKALGADDKNKVAALLDPLKQAISQVAHARAEVGTYQRTLADTSAYHENNTTEWQVQADRTTGLDAIKAASELAQAQNVLAAARLAGQELIQALRQMWR